MTVEKMMHSAYPSVMQAQDLGRTFKPYQHDAASAKGYYPMPFSNHGYHMIQANSQQDSRPTIPTNDCSPAASYYNSHLPPYPSHEDNIRNIQQSVVSSSEIEQNSSVPTQAHSNNLVKDELISSEEENSSSSSSISLSQSKHDQSEMNSERFREFDDFSKIPPKKRPLQVPDQQKDDTYWEKRKKNNISAKRSREARRMKEEQIAVRVVYLEQENLQLRTEVSLLKTEIEKLRCMLYNSC